MNSIEKDKDAVEYNILNQVTPMYILTPKCPQSSKTLENT